MKRFLWVMCAAALVVLAGCENSTTPGGDPVKESTPTAGIDYQAGTLTGLESGSYSFNGGPAVAVAAADTPYAIDETWFGTTLSIVKKGSSTPTDSAAQSLLIPARPPVPTGITGTGTTETGVNDGKISGVTTAMEYRLQGGNWTACPETGVIEGLAAGVYEVRLKAKPTESAFAGATASVTVAASDADPEETPRAEIDFRAETLTGLKSGNYSFNGGPAVTVSVTGTPYAIDAAWFGTTLTIVKMGDGINTADSLAGSLDIPARPDAPTGITGTGTTAVGSDGQISGVSAAMEYRLQGGTTWTTCTGTSVTGLAAGVYEVRLKATVSDFASQTFAVTVSDGSGGDGGEQFFKFSVKTTAAGETFSLPTSGYLNGTGAKTYDWKINWGDKTDIENKSGKSATDSPGISHTYAKAGTYQITIMPNGNEDAWLGAFGFSGNVAGANSVANKTKVISVDSPIRPLMTRTQAQITEGTAPYNEWAYTFYGCTNDEFIMGEGFRFSDEWNSITKAGNSFADRMFAECSGAAFTMNSVFNLPQNITTVGIWFAYSMFQDCSGEAFTMNGVFNLPPGITTAGDRFASYMFWACSGAKFTMNNVFNLPPLTTVGSSFADSMFYECSGAGFLVNGVFKFPKLDAIPEGAFYQTFNLGTNAAKPQTRKAGDIINGNAAPSSDRNTFGPSWGGIWSDYSSIDGNWRD
jgi:hypothetical protein